MRDFKGMKRQRGRNRKPGGGANAANPNRSWDSQGPENIKVRGNAQTVYERYMQLARDATASGDRVLAENYLQHAEHYFRVLRALQPARPVSEIAQRELSSQGFDIDFEDESGAQAAAFLAAQQAEQQRQQAEADRAAGRESQSREPQSRESQSRDSQSRDAQGGDRSENGDNGRSDAQRDRDGEGRENGRRESRRERWERRREERNRRFESEGEEGASAESSESADAGEAASDAPAPEPAAERDEASRPRRGRQPRAAADDVDAPAALPGFLTRSSLPESAPEGGEGAGDEPAPARRRAPRRKTEAPAED